MVQEMLDFMNRRHRNEMTLVPPPPYGPPPPAPTSKPRTDETVNMPDRRNEKATDTTVGSARPWQIIDEL